MNQPTTQGFRGSSSLDRQIWQRLALPGWISTISFVFKDMQEI